MATDLSLRQDPEIQGDIIAGFKKDHVRLLLLQFGGVDGARAWVGGLAPQIATTRRVAEFNAKYSAALNSTGDNPRSLKATWLGLSFTYEGLQFLTTDEKLLTEEARTGDTLDAFIQGPDGRLVPDGPSRATALGDTDDSAPQHWEFGGGFNPGVHAVLTVAADDVADLDAEVARQLGEAKQNDLTHLYTQEGEHLHGDAEGKEHFGFVDGTSQPAVEGFDEPEPGTPFAKGKPGTRMIPAGEFVIGLPGAPKHDPETAATARMPAWMGKGSFQVIRRLEQDVPGWWSQIDTQLRRLKDLKAVDKDMTRHGLAARVVGRWRDGTPVALSNAVDRPQAGVGARNDFGFKDDPDGLKTPLFSHLRKTNPRDGLIDHDEKTGRPELVGEEFMDIRRIMRRGIPYGLPFDPMSANPDCGPDGKRGLTFVCYQADLVGQFEFIQVRWINDSNFPKGRDPHEPGPDPMVSGELKEVSDGRVSYECTAPSGERQTVPLDFKPFVHTRGALYTFVPAISTLKRLALGDPNAKLPEEIQQGQKIPEPLPGQSLPVDAVLPVPGTTDRFWTFQQGVIRLIKIGKGERAQLSSGDVDDDTGLVTQTVGKYSAWPALQGVVQLDTILPVPDEQPAGDGTYGYWVFHTNNGKQVFRRIALAGAEPWTSRAVGDDQEMSRWRSIDPGAHVDAFLPVPDMQPAGDGRYGYWVFFTTQVGQRYRLISLKRSGQYLPDKAERYWDPSLIGNWGRALEGVTRVDAFLAVPTKENSAGKQWFWAFHDAEKYRVMTVKRDGNHDGDRITDDAPTAVWSRKQ
ncbi:Dyp-type peroxidase [Streptomyces luteireticuli]|uniref:Dyp-type peroxidase n=1 Tax=Streptomyces luteireticuli TaxID=173858 RepID=UPI003557485D